MGSDAVVALGRATVDQRTLFGQNGSRLPHGTAFLCQTPARVAALGEMVETPTLQLPQARQLCAVLGLRPAGWWGYEQGINEHQVAVGCVPLRPAGPGERLRLPGPDAVRLVLERSHSALHGVDVLLHLIERLGTEGCSEPTRCTGQDYAYLIADASEAYVIETAGVHWVCQQVREVRAVTGVRVVHQDWDRISRGLASHAIAQGWWPGDGSKLDFAAALGESTAAEVPALRRWGRAMLNLHEQAGHIDLPSLRRVLSDHGEEEPEWLPPTDHLAALCRHAEEGPVAPTGTSFIAALGDPHSQVALAWCAFGSPCSALYFPVFLDGPLPEAFTGPADEWSSDGFWWHIARLNDLLRRAPQQRERAFAMMIDLQAQFDQAAEELAVEASALKQRGATEALARQAGSFMQRNLERFEEALADCLVVRPLVAAGRH